ncbi:hypothetical protein Tco_0964088, partial [Tanacetum coccineum]
VPFTERVKIISTNVRLETTVPQKGETFQVVIDLVKNSSCFKASLSLQMSQKSLCSSSGILSRRENVDYPELIWEDLAYQIDHRKEKRSRRENMPFPRFIKVIINHFLKQHNSHSNLKFQHYHTIKDDGIVCRLKFVKIDVHQVVYWSDFPQEEQRLGSQRKKTANDSQEIVDVSEESKPKPKPAKIKTSSKSISQTEAEEAEDARQVC